MDSRDVDFIENDFISIGDANESLDLYELEELSGIPLSSSEGRKLVPKITRDNGSHSQPSGSVTFLVVSLRLRGRLYFVLLMSLLIGRHYFHLLRVLRENGWMDAMKDELRSMGKNSVWEFVDLPPGRKGIRKKCVLKRARQMGQLKSTKHVLWQKGLPNKRV